MNGLRLAERIRAMMQEGDFAPGERLVEADLSRQTGASRAHVREALRELRAEGLVEIEEFRGAAVKRLTRDDLRKIGDVRESLEGLAARLLATAIGPGQIAELKRIRAALVDAAADAKYEDYAIANEQFHSFVIAHCANEYVARFLTGLRVHIKRTERLTARDVPQLLEGNIEHIAIIDAVLLRSPDLAEALMRMHVRKGTAMIDQVLAAEEASKAKE